MAKNKSLNAAKAAKYDEFYTQYDVIQAELNHYEKDFEGKTVLCNCDDPFESNFCKFFLRNFNYLKLKRLICTSYAESPVVGEQMTIYDMADQPVERGHGYVMDITEIPMANGRGVSDDDIERLLTSKKRGVQKLWGDGSFDSPECLELLDQADIVVTNPPFSKFRAFVEVLLTHEKSFLIIGNMSAIGYDIVLNAFMDGRIWVGYECGSKTYRVPDTYDENKSFVKDGVRYAKMGNTLWYTNLDVSVRHQERVLYKLYDPEEYPHYINYDGIEVAKVKEIPKDYEGKMGVPLSFINEYNPDQFEIIGISLALAKPMREVAPKGTYMQGGNRFYTDRLSSSDKERGYLYHREYDRIVIRNKKPEKKDEEDGN